MKTIFTLIIATLLANGINAQAPNIDWETNLGGSDSDYGYSIRELSGGGYVVAGSAKSNDGDVSGNHGETDMWMAILDANGNLVNQFTYGGSNDDVAYDVQQTSDGGFVLAGYTLSNDGDVGTGPGNSNADMWMVKTDASGAMEWETTIGGGAIDEARSILETSSGKFVVVGTSSSTDIGVPNNGGFDVVFLRLNNAGNPELIKLYGGSAFDFGYSVEQTQDGGYIIGGHTESNNGDVSGNHGGYDGWALKLDANANPNIQWQTCLGGGADDYIHDIKEFSNGTYKSAGYSKPGSDIQFFVGSLQANGTISGQSTHGGTGNDELYALAETANGNYVVVGKTGSNDGDVSGNHGTDDIWIADIGGWQKCIGGSAQEYGYSIISTSDGGTAICGFTISSGGDVGGNNGNSDFWVVKLKDPLSVNEFGTSPISIYPNPAKGHFTINLGQNANVYVSVSNVLGQIVFSSKMNGAHMKIATHDWASGMYFVVITNGNGIRITRKILVE